ncbi:MAG: response regulator, partial [Gallionella sp.]
MPNMDGIELTRKIRRNEKYRSLPVILVTALENGAEHEAGLEAGANACIPKPSSNRQAFLDMLKKWV